MPMRPLAYKVFTSGAPASTVIVPPGTESVQWGWAIRATLAPLERAR